MLHEDHCFRSYCSINYSINYLQIINFNELLATLLTRKYRVCLSIFMMINNCKSCNIDVFTEGKIEQCESDGTNPFFYEMSPQRITRTIFFFIMTEWFVSLLVNNILAAQHFDVYSFQVLCFMWTDRNRLHNYRQIYHSVIPLTRYEKD